MRWKSLLKTREKWTIFAFFVLCNRFKIIIHRSSNLLSERRTENMRRLNFNAKRMPIRFSSITPFDKINKVSNSLCQLDNRKLVAVFYSKNKISKRRIISLRLNNICKSFYSLIKNFSNLLRPLTRSRKKQRQGPKTNFCSNCFQQILRKNYRYHTRFCESNSRLEIRMPLSTPIIDFVIRQKLQRILFVVYAYLEAIDVRLKIQ